MDKSMLIGLVTGAVAVTAMGGVAGYKVMKGPDYAEVIQVQPAMETVKIPREVCSDEVVQHQAPVKDKHRIAGTAIGAVVGGVVGNQFGGGSGKTLMTIGGAAAGGYAGNKVQKGMQESDTVATKETRCKTVMETQQKQVGFDVTYRLEGKEGSVRMDHDPGKLIPVKDGQLVLTAPGPDKS